MEGKLNEFRGEAVSENQAPRSEKVRNEEVLTDTEETQQGYTEFLVKEPESNFTHRKRKRKSFAGRKMRSKTSKRENSEGLQQRSE